MSDDKTPIARFEDFGPQVVVRLVELIELAPTRS
jgi:hypothetical protein